LPSPHFLNIEPIKDLEGQKNQITQLDEALKLQRAVGQGLQEKVWDKEAEITTMKEELAVKTERLNCNY
jgi:hypothetical protein